MSAVSNSRSLSDKPPSAGSKSSRASSGGQRVNSAGSKSSVASNRVPSGGSRISSGGTRSATSANETRNKSSGSWSGSRDKSSSAGKSRCSSGSSSRQSSAGSTHSTGRPARPSDKLNPKTIDPFHSSSSSHSAFATVYNNGGIPCRLMHGSVRHKLAWDQPPQELMFDPLLITLAEGLKENIHPYAFVSRQGFQELLATEVAKERTLPVLSKLIAPLRAALSHSDNTVFEESLQCLVQLSIVTGPALNQYLKNLLSPMSKRVMEKAFKEKVMTVLHKLEENGGRDAALAIKAKVPTYTTFL